MKKLYLFIFLIVIGGVMQIQPVNARANTLLTGKKAKALTSQTITFGAIATQTFGAADVTLTATATSGLAVILTSSNTSVATIVAGKLHIVGAGTATITASQPGDGLVYSAATNVTQNVTINKGGTAVITGLTATSITLQSADVTLAAASAFTLAIAPNNPITYTSSNPNVATIVNGRLHLVATGTTTITASQAGGANFVDAVPVNALYTVNPPAAPVFTTSLAGKVVGGADVDPAATVSTTYLSTITYTSSNIAAAPIVNNKIRLLAPVTAGSVTITAVVTYPIGTGGFGTITTNNTTLVITAAGAPATLPLALTFTAPGTKPLSDVDFIPAITTSSTIPAPITLTSDNPAVATIVNGNIHYVGKGTANIKASQQGTPAGTSAPATNTLPADVTQVLTVGDPTLTWTTIAAKLTNATDFTPTVTATLTNTPVTFVSLTPTIATIVNGAVHLTGLVGTATIKATQQNNTTTTLAPAANNLPADVSTSFAVTAPVAPVITFAALGNKQFSTAEVATGATTNSTITTPITYISSNPNVAFVTANSIATITINSFGQNYNKPGTYTNVPLIGGSGTGAQATIIVSSGGQAIPTITAQGRNYNANDILTITPASVGGTAGSGFAITVATTSIGQIHYVSAPAAPNNITVITATQGGGTVGTSLIPADVAQALTVIPLTLNFPTIGTKTYTAQDFNPGVTAAATSTRLIYLTSSNPAVATITATQAYALTSGGTLYTNGTYTNVPVAGGSGTGMLATIVVASGSVTTGSVITNPGVNYSNGDILTVNASSIGGTGSGLILTLGAYTGVIHYNNNVPATPNNTTVITASMGGGVNGTTTLAPDVSQVLTLTAPVINFPPIGTKQFTSVDQNPGATGALIGLPVTYTSSNPAVATIINGLIHFTGAPAAPNNTTVITASQTAPTGVNIGTQTIPASVSQTLTVIPATITFNALGTRTLGPDFNPGATSTITNTPIVYSSSNTAVATINSNGISGTTVTNGTLYSKSGTFVNVPLIGGTGTGATATIAVTNFGTALGAISNSGTGYTIGDVLTITPASISSTTGSGFSITVTAVSNMVHYVGAPAGNNTTVITASQGGGATGTLTLPADVSQTLTVNPPVISFPILGTKQFTSTDFSPGASSTLTGTPITYSSSNTAIASILTGTIVSTSTVSGTNYADGTYIASLLGGTGTGAIVTATFLTGNVPTFTVSGNTSGYTVGDILTVASNAFGTTGSGFNLTVVSVGSAVHFVSAPAAPGNTVTITASQGGGATGTATLPADVSQVLTVTPPTISFPTIAAKVYPSTDFILNATSTVNKAITYSAPTSSIATVTLLTGQGVPANTYAVHINSAPAAPNNTLVITASQGGGATGTSTLPADVSQTLVVSQVTPLFTFPALGTKVLTNVDVSLGVTSPLAGIPITYSSNNTAVATIVNGKLHMVSAGTATITASQGSAAGTLTIPADASQTVTITAPTLTFPPIGTRTYSNVDFNPGATSSITNIPVTYTSSNPAVATVNTTLQLGNLNGGTGYVSNTAATPSYTNVPLTGGTGSGAMATIVVTNGSVTSVIPTATGTLYTPGDILSCQALSIGGVGNGFNITVTSYYSLVHMVATYPAAPNNTTTIKASLGGGASGTASLPADVSQVLTIASPTLTFPAIGSSGVVAYTSLDFPAGASSTVTNVPITYTSSNPALAAVTNGQIHLVSQTGAGSVTIKASQQGGNGATATSTLPADVSQTFSVTAATYTFPALTTKQITSTDLDPAATSTALGLITYTSSNPAVASIVNNKIHYLTVGTTTITAFQNGINIGNSVLTVTAPTITFAAIGSKPFSTTDLAPGATSTLTAFPINYSSSNTAVVTIVNGNIHFVGTGSANITASQTTTGGVIAPASVTPATTITVTAPAITFGTLASRPFQVADLALTATSSLTTLPITYTSSDPNVATIVNGNVHFVGLGSTTITASQTLAAIAAGLPAPADVSQTLAVTAPTLTLAAIGTKVYNSTDLVLPTTSTYTSTLGNLSPVILTSSDPSVATIVYNAGIPSLHYVGIGTTAITASQAGFGNIPAPASVTQVLTVTPATLSIAGLGAKTTATADAAITPTVTLAVASVPVTYTTSDPNVVTVTGGTLHVVGVGTAVVTASQITSANYAPAPATGTVTVTTAVATTPVLSFTGPFGVRQYSNNGDITPTVTQTLTTVPVTYTSSNPLVATIVNGNIHLSPPAIINGVAVFPNPNTTVITASQGGGATGVAGSLPADVSQTLTVVPGGITFPPLGTQRFSTVDINPGATSSYTVLAADNTALPITYTSSDTTVASIVKSQIHFKTLGTTVITASQGGLVVPDVSQTMVVVPGLITFTPTLSRTLSTIDVAPGAVSTAPITYSSSDTTIVSIVNGNLHFKNVGVVTITATPIIAGTITTATAPYAATQILTVTPPTLTFTGTPSKIYTITDQDPGAVSTVITAPITYTSSNPALISIVNNKLHFNIVTQTGGYNNVTVITATQASIGNYPVVTATQTVTVTQGIIIQSPLTKYYGDPDFTMAVSSLGYPVAYSSATTATATTTNGGAAIHIVAPGTSVITASQPGDNNTGAATNVTSTLTVAPAPLVISPKNLVRLYGVENPIPYPLSYIGFKSSAGNAPLDDSTKFTVQPTLLSIVSNANPTVNLLPQYGGFIPKTLPVGVYTLTYGGAASTFYSFLYGTGTLTVTAATQTLTMDQTPITKKFGSADFDPLARSTGDPVVYTSSDNSIARIVSGKVQIVNVGVVTITATITPTSGNFSGSSSLSVQLTVVKGDQTITAANIPFLVKGSGKYGVNATASSKLHVQLAIADPLIAAISDTTLTPLHVGTTTVTVKQPGNAQYNAAPDVVLYLKVTDPSGDPVIAHQALSPNGDGINDFLLIEGAQDFAGNHVTIINRNGIKVFDTYGYDNKTNVFVGKSNNGDQLPEGTYFYRVDFNVGDQKNHITGYFVLKY